MPKIKSLTYFLSPFILLMSHQIAWANSHHALDGDFIVFLNAKKTYRYERPETSTLTRTTQFQGIDLFYSQDTGTWLMLAEYFIKTGSSMMERLQFGWRPNENQTIWIGRAHTPLGFWNTEYHHGSHLESSISRPTPTDRVLPRHISGFIFEDMRQRGNYQIHSNLSIGASPVLKGKGLMDLDLLHIEKGHDPQAILNVRMDFSEIESSYFGAFIGISHINSNVAGLNKNIQQQFGFELGWEKDHLKVISELFYFSNELELQEELTERTVKENFTSGFVQLEMQHTENIGSFYRIEASDNHRDDLWLTYTSKFVTERGLFGFKYDFKRTQSVNIEFSKLRQDGERFAQVIVQWSGILE